MTISHPVRLWTATFLVLAAGHAGAADARVQFRTASSVATEGYSDRHEIQIKWDAPLSQRITMPVRISAGNARLREDFELDHGELQPDGTFLFYIYPGQSLTGLWLRIIDDGLPEQDESVTLEFGPLPAGVTVGANSRHTVTIKNQPASVRFAGAFKPLYVRECQCGVQLPIQRVGDTNLPLTVRFATHTNLYTTALAGLDFVPRDSLITFGPGERHKTVEIQLLNDGRVEEPAWKGLVLQLFGSAGGRESSDEVYLNIQDAQKAVGDLEFFAEVSTEFYTNWANGYFDGRQHLVAAAALGTDGRLLIAEYDRNAIGVSHSKLIILGRGGLRERRLPTAVATGIAKLAWLSDGKILLSAGWDDAATGGFVINGQRRHGLARLHADGSLDETFRPPPSMGQLDISEIKPLPDGRLVVSARGLSDSNGSQLYRLLADGTLDPGFNPIARIESFVVDSLERITALSPSGDAFRLFRMNPDGSLDTSFHSTTNMFKLLGNHFGAKLVLATDGSILVPRVNETPEGVQVCNLVRFREDGTVERSFPLPMDHGDAPFLFVEPSGNVIVGHERMLWRVDANGAPLIQFPLGPVIEHASMEFLGVWEQHALIIRQAGPGFDLFRRLIGVPLVSPPPTAFVFDPYDIPDWREWIPSAPLPTEVLEGRRKRIRVQRLGDVLQPASVIISTRNVTAKAGEDYVAIRERIEFAPLETEKMVDIPVLEDGLVEPEERFELVLSEATGVDAVAEALPIRIVDHRPGLRIDSVRPLAGGGMEIAYNWQRWMGPVENQRYSELQFSDDLRIWKQVESQFDSATVDDFYRVRVVDDRAIGRSQRFYRLWSN